MKNMLDSQEIWRLIHSNDKVIVFGFAPICMNCQIAYRMIQVVRESHPFELYEIDLNYHESLINHYEITSAPCLLLFGEGELKHKIYAFHDVLYLSEEVKKFLLT